jgi:hypothetical protein
MSEMRLTKKQQAWLKRIKLSVGGHESPDKGACVMEVVAYIAGEPWSDKPKCASQVIGAFMRRWNDDLDDAGRQKLKPYVRKLVGTAASLAVEDARAWLACDWIVRVHTAAWLELAGLKDQAMALRELPPITKANCHDATATITKAREKAFAAWDAARAAAWAAAKAAGAALEPTKVSLQQSAFDLLDRMIALKDAP